jgi:hypothetical protein
MLRLPYAGGRFGLIVASLLVASGCEIQRPAAKSPPKDLRVAETKTAQKSKSPEKSPTVKTSSPATPPETVKIGEQLQLARQQVRDGQLDEARQSLDAISDSQGKRTPQESVDLAALEVQWLEKSGRARGEVNAKRLVHVGTLLDQKDWDAAASAVEQILAAEPDDAHRQEAVRLNKIIESHKAQVGRLEGALLALAGDDLERVQQAQERLFENPAAAVTLLKVATTSENHRLVRRALESLGKLPALDDTLEVILSVLENPAAETNWPDAVEQIGRLDHPGAGPRLLKLATSSESDPQRIAALSALALVDDPPLETFVALLPVITAKGPDLVAALLAAQHAVTTHGQQDLLRQQGLSPELSEETQNQLAAFPERLAKIIASENVSAANAARHLAIATRQQASPPLENLRVLAFSGEVATSPAAAVLDGLWKTVTKTQMWQHPVKQPGVLVLDLGKQRTVTGIRIWNFNETGGMHRGWKDVKIFVGSTPDVLATVTARGQIPAAPGKATEEDYSTVIPIDFVRGRYVRLEAENQWRADQYGGLSEVQVLGF